MQTIALLNKKGLTLIEVLVSLVVLLIVFLAVMTALATAVSINAKNALRSEAVAIADERIDALKNTPLTDLTIFTDTGGSYIPDDVDPDTAGVQSTITRSFRNFDVVFTSRRMVEDIVGNKRVTIQISWTWRGENYAYEAEIKRVTE